MGDVTWGRVYLARHGRTALNAAGLLRGRLDPSLDEVGREEGRRLAQLLAPHHLVSVVTSPLSRAVETGRFVADLAKVPLVTDEGLLDRDYGRWAGQEQAEVIARFGRLDAAPGVEASQDVLARAQGVLDAWAAELMSGSVVLIAHDAVNRILLTALDPALGEPEDVRQRTGCVNVLARLAGRWAVEQVDQFGGPS